MRSLHKPLDQGGCSRIPAIDEDRPDQRLADVRQDGGAGTPTGIGLRGPKSDRGPEFDRAPDIRARFLADEVGKADATFPFIGPRERAKQHVGDHEAEHVIAEKSSR
jgi:hypothetical protein